MVDEKKPVVTEVKKPLIPLPLFIVRRRRKILFIIIIILTVAGGAFAYDFYKAREETKLADHHGFKKVTFEGREYKVPNHTLHSEPPPSNEPVISLADQIKEQEAKIAAGKPTYKDYLQLAQLYTVSGNKSKAIENYRLSQKTATPDMENYQQFIATVDDLVKKMEAN